MAEQKSSVYETLREAIINLAYKPGEELDTNAIAEKLGVSRSPVRDALLRLSSDKLVDIFPQKGTRVSLLNKEIIRQERFMRVALELGVLEECMKSLADDTKRKIFATKLQGFLLAQHASILDGDNIAFLKYDDEMHHLFYSEANCEWIWETLISRTGNDHRIRLLSCNALGFSEKIETEHKDFAEKVENGNITEILEINRQHLSRLYDEIDGLERNFPEYFEA